MPKAWQVPTGDDLWQVVSRSVLLQADEDSVGGTSNDNNFNSSLDTRAKKAVEHAVAEVRGAIESAGRYPVSATPYSVPPEGVQHTLALAAWRLASVKPSLLATLLAEGGSFSPIGQLFKDAKEWLKMLQRGGSFTEPTNPAGADYTNAVSASNPAVSGIKWGDSVADDTEYDAGITESGVVVSSLTNNMNTQ